MGAGIPKEGIATDCAHSMKNGRTQYRGVDLSTGEQLFIEELGNQTVNIGEFLGLVAGVKYIIEHDYEPKILFTDSMTAITWYRNKCTASKKRSAELLKAEIFLEALSYKTTEIKVRHWDNAAWGEIPADFGNK